MKDIKESYTSASSFPIKLLYTLSVYNGKIIPVHAQLMPTNTCNLSCSFCSCDDRDKKLSFTFPELYGIIDRLKELGTKAITITGGGEPMCHPNINNVIKYAENQNIRIGLVSNGILLDKLKSDPTWCRISSDDSRESSYRSIEEAVRNNKTDFAFSHVVSARPNYDRIEKMIYFANEHNFTHIRMVNDLLDLENSMDVKEVENRIKGRGIDDHLVIYQGRKNYTKGRKECYISLLKPVISPDRKIYPCCGSQYSVKGQKKDMVLSMGNIEDLENIINEGRNFDGSVCNVCYYDEYNKALTMLKKNLKHKEFV